MKLLILGGTIFVGRHIVEAAMERGHEVTLFNRGLSNPDLFPDLEFLRGDRDGSLDALKGRRWDAVVDTSGELPGQVWESAKLLADATGHYTLLSSIMVYSDFGVPRIDEDSPVEMLDSDDDAEEPPANTFGALKAVAEKAAQVHLPGRVLVARAGLPVGPYDFTDRLAYWPRRVAEGGEVLAPGNPGRPVQFIDARDLAGWIVTMAEKKVDGTFNVTGPDYRLSLGKLLDTCKQVSGSDATFTWVDDDFLFEHELVPLYDIPIWLPDEEGGVYLVDCSKAIANGLTFRPLEETLRDVLMSDMARVLEADVLSNGRPPERMPGETGIVRHREARLLKSWHRRMKTGKS